MKRKLKTKFEVVRRQEKSIAEKDKELSRMKESCTATEVELDRLKSTFMMQEKELSNSKSKLEESAKLLENNQQVTLIFSHYTKIITITYQMLRSYEKVIAWLNREINDSHIGGNTIYPSSAKYCAQNATSIDPSTSFQPSFNACFSHTTPEPKGVHGNYVNNE